MTRFISAQIPLAIPRRGRSLRTTDRIGQFLESRLCQNEEVERGPWRARHAKPSIRCSFSTPESSTTGSPRDRDLTEGSRPPPYATDRSALGPRRFRTAGGSRRAGIQRKSLGSDRFPARVLPRAWFVQSAPGRPPRRSTAASRIRVAAKYLRRLFCAGPVSQGNPLANLRTPAFATDASFGTSY